ncbi:anoctamin-10-like [Oscarella lobularis]|uniref:anoctamin-10-like n=1 Tax=Oscarella lobularis TaxID=121494 RepID=UPI003313AC21
MAHFLHFTAESQEDGRHFLLERLRKEGFEVEVKDDVVIVKASAKSLADEAETLRLEKPLVGSYEEVLGVRIPQLDSFKTSRSKEFVGGADLETFFTSADQTRLTWSILLRIPYDENALEQYGHIVANPSEPFIIACQNAKPPLIEFIKPMHESKEKRREIENAVVWGKFVPNKAEINQIRDYFGEEVALYFVWIAFMAKMMLLPAALSLVWYFFRYGNIDIVKDPFMPIFAALMALWSILYLVLWRCHCSEFAFWWHTYDYRRVEEPNPNFEGVMRRDPVTDKMVKYFSFAQRLRRYFVSFAVMLVMVALAVLTMIVSLNLNGYVTMEKSPIYIRFLASFAAPGGLFALDSPYYGWIIPAFGHTIFIGLLNAQYKKVAAICTDFENHRSMDDWRNSLIGKRVIFEALNCFIAPLYITFYQMDVAALRRQMMRLFACDEIRRVVTETGLPFLTGQVKQLDVEKKKGGAGIKVTKTNMLEDESMSDYEQFADYLEMVIQFGYVTLFAAALPAAAIVSILFLMIETRSDMWSLLHAHCRPRVRRACDIGVWYYVMFAMVALSMLTNSFIVFVSSDQMDYWLPRSGDNFSHDLIKAFSVEHVLVFLALLAHAYLPSQFAWVRAAIERRSYQKRMKAVSAIGRKSIFEALDIRV